MDFDELSEKASRALFIENVALNDLLNVNLLANQEARDHIASVIFETYLHVSIIKWLLEAIKKTNEALSEPVGQVEPNRLKSILNAQDQDEAEAMEFYSQASIELEDGFLKDLFTAIVKDEERHHKIVSETAFESSK